jgi:predicted Zn finger-like uncharacterized protein
MLFTRCPDCHTTFRITNEALHKADGQVRCGRCSNVFNAFADLHERPDPPAAEPGAAPPPPLAVPASAAPPETPNAPPALEVVQASSGAEPDAGADEGIGPNQVDAVLEQAERHAHPLAAWHLEAVDEAPERRTWSWHVGAGLAAVLLAAQLTHHFSAELATRGRVGPVIQRAYALFGMTIVPHWEVEQYELVDWVAAAEPNARGQGNLVITARIHNRGPRAQPYPYVQLQLLDRFEAAVGRRVFASDEYLPAQADADAMMQPGDTAEAQLTVVDPGPDAYGFELDVCVATESSLACAADEVFR